MKFSVNWLREFVDLPENPEEIADLLTRAGVETENIETRGANDLAFHAAAIINFTHAKTIRIGMAR